MNKFLNWAKERIKHYVGNEDGIFEFMGIPDSVIIPALTSLAGSMLQPKQGSVSLESQETPEQKNARKQLAAMSGSTYGGALGSYDMTDIEKQGLGKLQAILSQAQPITSRLGSEEVQRVLGTSAYDPYAEKGIYSGLKRNVMKEAGEAENILNRQAAMTGGLRSTGLETEKGKLVQETSGKLSDILGQLYQQYGNQRLQAAQLGSQMGAQEQQQELAEVQASQTMGNLERMLKDAEAKDKYAAWQNEQGQKLKSLSATLGYQPQYGLNQLPTYEANPWTKLIDTSIDIFGKNLGKWMGGNKTGTSNITQGETVWQA